MKDKQRTFPKFRQYVKMQRAADKWYPYPPRSLRVLWDEYCMWRAL